MFKEKTLYELGQKYNADLAKKDYLNYYEYFFKDLKKQKFTLIELGIGYGASIKIWKEYFKKANIIGIDTYPINIKEKNVEIINADVNNTNLSPLLEKYKDINIIIDDCSHAWWQQINNYENLFPLLNKNGYYIIEDIFFGIDGDIHFKKSEKYSSAKCSFIDYSKSKIDSLKYPISFRLDKFTKIMNITDPDIGMISYIPGAVIIKKM